MATSESTIVIGSQIAAVDLSQKKYRLLKRTSSGLDIASTGDRVVGVNKTGMDGNVWPAGVRNMGKAGDAIEMDIFGLTKVKVGSGNLNEGDFIMPGATTDAGLAVALTATRQPCGQVFSVGGALAGSIAEVLFFPPNWTA